MAALPSEREKRRARKNFAESVNSANKVKLTTISPGEIAFAFEIAMSQPVKSAHDKLGDSMFGGYPSVFWQTKQGRKIFPQLEEIISEHGARFGRNILRTLDTLGFVPIKVAYDEASGLRLGFIPDFTQNDVHVIQNLRNSKTELALFQHNRQPLDFVSHGFDRTGGFGQSMEGRYDDDVHFFYETMPTADGHLRSKVMSLAKPYQAYAMRLQASITTDLRTIQDETGVRLRDDDDGDAVEDAIGGGNRALAQSFAATREIYEQRIRGVRHFGGTDHTAHGGRHEQNEQTVLAIIPHIRSRTIKNRAGTRTYTELPTNAEIVPLPQPRSASDLAKVTQLFTSAAAQAIGIPPSITSDRAAIHGKGITVANSELNTTVNRRSQVVRNVMQRALDVTYGADTKLQIRRFMLRGIQRKNEMLRTLDELLRAQQRRINKKHGPADTPPITMQDIFEQKTVSESEFNKIWDENRIHVVLNADIRITVQNIRELHEVDGFIDTETKRNLLASTLNLSRELLETGTGISPMLSSEVRPTRNSETKARTRTRSRSRERDRDNEDQERNATRRKRTQVSA